MPAATPLPDSPQAWAAIDQRLDRIARSAFRARIHLQPADRAFIAQRGLETVRQHAYDLLARRLAPACPPNDGRQTPWRGHPVFRAQHATGTCCRTCLARLHAIPKGQTLTAAQLDELVALIDRWLARELGNDHGDGQGQESPEPARQRPQGDGPLFDS